MLSSDSFDLVVRNALIKTVFTKYDVNDDCLKLCFEDVLKKFEAVHRLNHISPIRDDILSEIIKMKEENKSRSFSEVTEMLRLCSSQYFSVNVICAARFTNPQDQFYEIIAYGVLAALRTNHIYGIDKIKCFIKKFFETKFSLNVLNVLIFNLANNKICMSLIDYIDFYLE